MNATDTVNLADTVLARQLLSDEAPPVSSVIQTETTLTFTWRGRYDRLVVEISLDRRAHWRYDNRGNQAEWEHHQDADDGWEPDCLLWLMRFNRRAA